MNFKENDRVGAIISTDPKTKTVMFAGYGIYQCEIVPSEPGKVFSWE